MAYRLIGYVENKYSSRLGCCCVGGFKGWGVIWGRPKESVAPSSPDMSPLSRCISASNVCTIQQIN